MKDLLHKVAKDRDVEAFGKLCDMYRGPLIIYMQRQGVDEAAAQGLADDVLQMVWSEAERRAKPGELAVTFIFRIARDLRISRLRKQKAWRAGGSDHDCVGERDEAAKDHADGQDRQQQIAMELAKLPREQSEIVQLSFLDGLSHSAIAERLNIPLAEVKSRLRLAYSALRGSLEGRN